MMRRREFITLLGGAAAVWPVAARAQQWERVRRIGVLLPFAENDPEALSSVTAFKQTLELLARTDGNVRIEYRWAPDIGRIGSAAVELVATEPDVILTATGVLVAALKRATRTIPIVFVLTPAPVGVGLVTSLARPGGNLTGFTHFEYQTAGKWLELLKEIAPTVERVLTFAGESPMPPQGVRAMGALETVAQAIGVKVISAIAPNAAEIRRVMEELERGQNRDMLTFSGPGIWYHR